MSKMTDEEMASFVTSQMTVAFACTQDGSRSPEKVGRLVEQLQRQPGFQNSLRFLAENDTALYKAAAMVKSHHPYNDSAREKLWNLVIGNLHNFAEQKGGQRLLNRARCAAFLDEVREKLKAKAREAQVCTAETA
tara:strand:+ start:991 stop:1395 length:405 start_codon:yes stop_codon:yes gene_type:complete